jgi:hypothetical protein
MQDPLSKIPFYRRQIIFYLGNISEDILKDGNGFTRMAATPTAPAQ